MEEQEVIRQLLNEAIELLSSDKKPKQKKGFSALRGALALGSAEAYYLEGLCYQKGLGIYQSDEQAFNRFEQVADKIPEAMCELGRCYIHGLGTEQDVDKAFECFNDAAQSGLPEAMFELAVCYRYGEGTKQDIKTALSWYEKAADLGYLMAFHNMGIIYQNGLDSIPVDYAKAFDCFMKAAQEENPNAFFCIGNSYLGGWGVEKDEKEAAIWFKKAAELGEPDSMFHLAWMYQEGLGVEKNQDLATDYLYQSAEAGWEPAIKAIKGEE